MLFNDVNVIALLYWCILTKGPHLLYSVYEYPTISICSRVDRKQSLFEYLFISLSQSCVKSYVLGCRVEPPEGVLPCFIAPGVLKEVQRDPLLRVSVSILGSGTSFIRSIVTNHGSSWYYNCLRFYEIVISGMFKQPLLHRDSLWIK